MGNLPEQLRAGRSAHLRAGPVRRLRDRWWRRAASALACVALLMPAAAWSHAFWLVPFGPTAEPGQRVALDLRIGPRWPGASTPRLDGLVASFHVADAQGSQPIDGRSGGRPFGHFRARLAGAAVVTLQTNPSTIELPGDQFQEYLREEALDDALKMRADLGMASQPAREDFSRAAKTLVFVGGSSRGFDRDMGLPMELIPLTDPLAYRPGQPFRVKLRLGGKAAAQVRITALPKDEPDRIVRATTGADGEAQLTLPHAGLWTFYAVHMQPAARPPADFDSLWASLTFGVPEAPR